MSPSNQGISHPLRGLLGSLVAAEVEFVICGGVACILQGVARVTHDVDLCLRMDRDNLLRFIAAARDLHLSPRAPVPLESLADPATRSAWLEHKGALVFSLNVPNDPLPIAYEELRHGADLIQVGAITVPVSSKRDLIRAKQQVNPARRIDQRDIEDLQELIRREQAR